MAARLCQWYKSWFPPHECVPTLPYTFQVNLLRRLGTLLQSTFKKEFKQCLFAALPPSFPVSLKQLCNETISGTSVDRSIWHGVERHVWEDLEVIGLIERYENLISSVCYERIEEKAKEKCTGVWDERCLFKVRVWTQGKLVNWMIKLYAREAKSRQCKDMSYTPQLMQLSF